MTRLAECFFETAGTSASRHWVPFLFRFDLVGYAVLRAILQVKPFLCRNWRQWWDWSRTPDLDTPRIDLAKGRVLPSRSPDARWGRP